MINVLCFSNDIKDLKSIENDDFFYSIYFNDLVSESDKENLSSKSIIGESFSKIRNKAISKFLDSSDKKFIYISNLGDINFKETLNSLQKVSNTFLFNSNPNLEDFDISSSRILGYTLDREIIEFLGGFNYYSEIIMGTRVSQNEKAMISNEALDWDYLGRYLKYLDFLRVNEEIVKEDLSLEWVKPYFKKNPTFFRKFVNAFTISDYYMLYMNSISSFLKFLKINDELIENYEKIFSRLKRSALTEKVKSAQRSFIKGILFYNPKGIEGEE
jgi:hypothetical protein